MFQKLIIYCCGGLILLSCNTHQIDSIEQKYIIQLPGETPEEGELVHHVLLDLKEDLSEETLEAFMTSMQSLGGIKGVKNFHYGKFEDLGDQRALSIYDFMMSMSFDEVSGYEAYQLDKVHEQVKAGLEQYLAGPPATYDLIVE